MNETIATNLARNIKQLRQNRNLTQQQLSKSSDIPRPTWANLESGTANPTVSILAKVAAALQVQVEELISAPKASVKYYPAESIPKKVRGGVSVRKLLPDYVQGIDLERMEIPQNAQMIGIPHRSGTREYLVCESGHIDLFVSGEMFKLGPGDVVVFRGDQKHSYRNNGTKLAVGYSTVLLAPGPTD